MSKQQIISSSYKGPIVTAVVLQLLSLFLSSLILDTGITNGICVIAFIAFWGGAAILILRRPRNPTATDLVVIQFGYPPIAAVAWFLVPWIWRMR